MIASKLYANLIVYWDDREKIEVSIDKSSHAIAKTRSLFRYASDYDF